MKFLNRTACLGANVTEMLFGKDLDYNNGQKLRLDLFLDIIKGNVQKPNSETVIAGLYRFDMSGVYGQSEKLLWLTVEGKPNYLIMDNYSELTDKRFRHKDGWDICGLYNDFKPEFLADVEDLGLLDPEKMHSTYNEFFEYVKNRWNVPIIYMHFPTTFETREKYIKQGKSITEALDDLAPKFNIQNIHAEPDSIEQADNDVYHFTKKTFKNMFDKIKK